MITIIDYKTGNSGSIHNVYRRIGLESRITSSPTDILDADALILPGVGSFDRAMQNLEEMNLIPVLEESVLDQKIPFLGICVGMQVLAHQSEEGNRNGLGWIDASIQKFEMSLIGEKKVPHMGWNNLLLRKNDPVTMGLNGTERFYFVHSYHYTIPTNAEILATTSYGYEFPSLIKKENIYGIQCHPERSHSSGIAILRNFATMGG
ncbi:MAG: imidazole glycerol phosphate synthase subunit HisH [Methanospirillaceae archaeon]|nr:imidazole glycerol phosphate synthase subunit HisH [Methanospirillaceae archaeon]